MLQINFWDEIKENVNEEELNLAQKVIEHIMIKEGCPFDCEVNLTMTDNVGIQEINREFRDNSRRKRSFLIVLIPKMIILYWAIL